MAGNSHRDRTHPSTSPSLKAGIIVETKNCCFLGLHVSCLGHESPQMEPTNVTASASQRSGLGWAIILQSGVQQCLPRSPDCTDIGATNGRSGQSWAKVGRPVHFLGRARAAMEARPPRTKFPPYPHHPAAAAAAAQTWTSAAPCPTRAAPAGAPTPRARTRATARAPRATS